MPVQVSGGIMDRPSRPGAGKKISTVKDNAIEAWWRREFLTVNMNGRKLM